MPAANKQALFQGMCVTSLSERPRYKPAFPFFQVSQTNTLPNPSAFDIYPRSNGDMSNNTTVEGWVSHGGGRGTLDIVYTCVLTIFLCVWTSVCPNIPAITDSRFDRFRDKFNLACIGILGPDFLLCIAVGQRSSARRSLKASQYQT